MSLVSTSGIRGPVGQTVTADLALNLGRVIATRSGDRVVVGHDSRETSEWLTDGLTAGLRSCGADVVNVGLVATPTLARSVEWTSADLGVMVTASHNPAEYNGFKLVEPSGCGVSPAEVEELVDAIRTTAHESVAWNRAGTQRVRDGMNRRHVEAIGAEVDPIDDLTVVVDVGNGAGGITIEALRALGAEVVSLYAEPNGRFPNRPSEPTADHCTELRRRVAETDADLGIALDGDADRMHAVAEDGAFIQGDVLLATFAREAASAGERIVAPINTSLAVDDTLEPAGIDVIRTPIGDTHVAARAAEDDVAFGGEPSGAWIWPDSTLSPDGPMAACRLASLVDDRGPMSDLVSTIETYPLRRESIEVPEKYNLMERIESAVLDEYGERCSTVDGVFVEFADGWFLIRPSGTEPVIRVTAEGATEARAAVLLEQATDQVNTARGQ